MIAEWVGSRSPFRTNTLEKPATIKYKRMLQHNSCDSRLKDVYTSYEIITDANP